MKAKKIIVNAFSDGEHRWSMMASHPNAKRNFSSDWNVAMNRTKKKYPDEWQVSDVEEVMKEFGWLLEEVETVEISY